MVLAVQAASNGQCPLHVISGLGVAMLQFEQRAHSVQRGGRLRVIAAAVFQLELQGLPGKFYRRGQIAGELGDIA
jgi:hypothetical protein